MCARTMMTFGLAGEFNTGEEMTTYFDRRQTEISAAGEAEDYGRLCEIERLMVWDVGICSEMPGFPADLKLAFSGLVLRWGVSTLPLGVPEPDLGEIPAYTRQIGNLCGDLHTLFHTLARREMVGFSDSPEHPLRCLAARAEEAQAVLYEEREKGETGA